MRLLNRLTITNLKQNRRRTIMTIIGIMLSVALITSIANLYVSAEESLIVHVKKKTGDYHYGFQNMSKEDIDKLRQNRDVETISIMDQDVYVRYTKEALRENVVVKDADFVNERLIELERGIAFDNNPEMNTLVHSAIIVMFMIILTSIMCIKNSFDISISERIRQYGMLASIGATKRQIRKNVYYEATILAAIGIPFGLALGILSSYLLIRVCDKLFEDILVFDLIYSFSVFAAIIATLLSIFTIYFSSSQSARKASKIMPIQSIRDQNTITICENDMYMPKWIRRYLGIGGEIAYKNLQRSKQKYKTTIACLVICVSLFIAVSSFVSIGMQRIEAEYKDKNHNISVEYSRNIELYGDSDSMLKQYIDTIKEMDCVEKATYSGNNRFYIDEDTSVNFNIIDDDSFREYTEKVKLDYEQVKDKGISYLYIEEDTMLKGYTKKWIPGESKHESKIIDIPYELEIVMGSEEVPFGLEKGKECIIFNANAYKELIDGENIFIYTANPDKTEKDLSKLLEEFVNPADTFWLINLEENEKENRSFYTLLAIFLYSLIIVIAGVGITNMFNIISANMILRKREFAMLKSIGMTSKEFNRMILLESFFYGRAALVVGIPVGLALSYLLYGDGGSDYTPYSIPYKAIVISSVVVLLLISIIMKYGLDKFNKESIIETIRKETI